MNCLVIQTSFVGDCVLSLPFLYRLLESQKNADVHVVAQPVGARLFELARHRGLSQFRDRIVVHEFHKKTKALKTPWGLSSWARSRGLRRGEKSIDVAFCLQRSFRSAALAYLCGAKERVGFSSGGASFLYTSVVGRSWNNGQSEIEKNIDLLRVHSGNSNIGSWVFDLNSPSLLAQNVPVKKVPRRIILSIGSPWPTKDWPVQNVVQYINQAIEHDCEVVLTGDQSAIHKSKEIENSILSAKFVNRVGQTTLEEWVDLIASAELVVSGDSASIHVASDLKVPVLALFGPTVPDFGFAPWRSPSLVLGVNDLKCRPCDIHGPKTCPLGHHKCMTNIKPEKVWGFSSDFIEKRRL